MNVPGFDAEVGRAPRPSPSRPPSRPPDSSRVPHAAPSRTPSRAPKVGYLVSRFPHLPETFILREIDQLVTMGVEVMLCPLLRQRDEVVHPAAEPWIDRARYTPFISPTLVADLIRTSVRSPLVAGRGLVAPFARVATTPNFLAGTAGIVLKVAHLARVVEEEGIDHVHAHFATHPAMAAYMLHQLTGVSYSFTVHAHDLYVQTAMLDRKLRDAAFVVTISDYNRRRLRAFERSTPVHVIRSGVDLEQYPVQNRPIQAGTSGRPFTLVAVGSLQPYKGFRHLIAAMGILRSREVGDLRLQIVGGGPDRAELEEQIDALGVRGQVELLGPLPQEDVARLLQAADAFVLPSIVTPSGKMEGLPVVLIEALATGLPTIATDISGIPELVRDGETGQLVPPEDPASLAEAIQWVVGNPGEARRRAEVGRRLVEREHDLAVNVARLAQLFKEEVAT